MASAKAMDRIDWTMIFVDAPGFRPTATDAPLANQPYADGRAQGG